VVVWWCGGVVVWWCGGVVVQVEDRAEQFNIVQACFSLILD